MSKSAEYLPWHVIHGVYDSSPEASEFPHGPEIVYANGDTVAFMNLYAEDEASFIVRAVNSHAALVAACMALRSAYDKGAGTQEIESNSVDWSDVDMAHELALEALTLAKGA